MAKRQLTEPRVTLIFRGKHGRRQIIELPRTEIERGKRLDKLQRDHGTLLRVYAK